MREANSAIRRLVTDGASSASPAAITLTAATRGGAEDLPGCLQSVHDGHPYVHQHDVGAQVPDLADRVGSVGCLTDDLQAGLGG